MHTHTRTHILRPVCVVSWHAVKQTGSGRWLALPVYCRGHGGLAKCARSLLIGAGLWLAYS